MSENEKILLEKAKNGDLKAFELLIEGYQKKVYNIALRMIGNHDDANELAQEVFIRILKSIKNFKEESTFSTWVYRITTNICLDELRKRKNRKTVSIDEEMKLEDGEVARQIEDIKPLPDIIAERNELKKIVTEAIQLLSEEHKLVIVMRDIQGFSYEEIAKVTKIPEGTVKSRINRARLALKEILKSKRELFSDEYVKQYGKEG
ncbi:MAG: sigma-70 family RNA polymerase sigma factor [Clostridia bacterium]|nr:sigma-70 family RNA polymerase sigma factor [Clostridia bacterium]